MFKKLKNWSGLISNIKTDLKKLTADHWSLFHRVVNLENKNISVVDNQKRIEKLEAQINGLQSKKNAKLRETKR